MPNIFSEPTFLLWIIIIMLVVIARIANGGKNLIPAAGPKVPAWLVLAVVLASGTVIAMLVNLQ